LAQNILPPLAIGVAIVAVIYLSHLFAKGNAVERRVKKIEKIILVFLVIACMVNISIITAKGIQL
jgi:hypothetical protein